MSQTVFHPRLAAMTDQWLDLFGYLAPSVVTDTAAEWRACRETAALMDFSMLRKLEIEGASCLDFVNSLVTRDVSALAPGRIAYGALCDDDGKMIDDCTVLVRSPERLRFCGANDPGIRDLVARRPGQVPCWHGSRPRATLGVESPTTAALTYVTNDARMPSRDSTANWEPPVDRDRRIAVSARRRGIPAGAPSLRGRKLAMAPGRFGNGDPGKNDLPGYPFGPDREVRTGTYCNGVASGSRDVEYAPPPRRHNVLTVPRGGRYEL